MVSFTFPTAHSPTVNRGDVISKKPQTIEEKAKQIAVDKYDLTGTHIQVPTYFVVNYPNGETKALHHVRDAQAISDVIRQMHLEEEIDHDDNMMSTGGLNGFLAVLIIAGLALFFLTSVVVIGIF